MCSLLSLVEVRVAGIAMVFMSKASGLVVPAGFGMNSAGSSQGVTAEPGVDEMLVRCLVATRLVARPKMDSRRA